MLCLCSIFFTIIYIYHHISSYIIIYLFGYLNIFLIVYVYESCYVPIIYIAGYHSDTNCGSFKFKEKMNMSALPKHNFK